MPFRAKTKNKAALAANDVADAAKERKTKIAVAASASAVNLVLGIVKVLAGIYTNSLAIVTDGVNNFGDVVSNAGAAIGFGVENKPPTRRFPGGFGRVEYVVTFLMALIIVAVGGGFAYSAMDRIFYHPVVTFAWTQFGIVAATIAVKVGLAVMFRLAGKKFPSGVLSAQTTDSVLDACITTFALLGALPFAVHTVPRGRRHRAGHQRRDDSFGHETRSGRVHASGGRGGLQACKWH